MSYTTDGDRAMLTDITRKVIRHGVVDSNDVIGSAWEHLNSAVLTISLDIQGVNTMKIDELMNEYAPKAAAQAQERAARPHAAQAQGPTAKQHRKQGKGKRQPEAPKEVAVPLGTRQEVYEALELLGGGNIVITSIKGGKAKKGVNNRANDTQE